MVGLQQLGATLLQERDFDHLLRAISLQLQTLTDADGVAVALLEEDERYFKLRTVVWAWRRPSRGNTHPSGRIVRRRGGAHQPAATE